jgi:hypothetical protein
MLNLVKQTAENNVLECCSSLLSEWCPSKFRHKNTPAFIVHNLKFYMVAIFVTVNIYKTFCKYLIHMLMM